MRVNTRISGWLVGVLVLTASPLGGHAQAGAVLPMPKIKLTPPSPPPPDFGVPLSQAIDEAEAGDYTKAIADAEKSLALAERQLSSDDKTLAQIVGILADMHLAAREYDQAKPLIRRALAIEGRPAEERDVELEMAQRMASRAQSMEFDEHPKFEQATHLLQSALAIREKILGPHSPFVAASLYDLANNRVFLKQYMEAEKLYKRAIAICEKDQVGRKDNLVAILNDLALMYLQQHRYGDAESSLKHALAITQQTPGIRDSLVAQVVRNLGEVFRQTGRQAEAEAMERKAQAQREATAYE